LNLVVTLIPDLTQIQIHFALPEFALDPLGGVAYDVEK